MDKTLLLALAIAAPAWADEPAPPSAETLLVDNDGSVDALADAEAKRLERMAAIEASQSKKAARVVVLKWQGTETDFSNDTLQRNVRARIARPDAKFYPDVDLYQAGRRMPDRSIRAGDQMGSVPSSNIPPVLAAIEDVAPIPWNGMSESDWGLKAHELRDTADKIWFVDRPELREPLFLLYVQIGRAAENANNPAPPFYEQVGGQTVNWYWYLAGTMGHTEPGIMSKITDPDLYSSVDYYKQMLDSGRIPPMTLAFGEGGVWDAKAFAGEYQVFINGIEAVIEDRDSLYKVPPGRVDVYLQRTDGHSISDSIDITKLADKIYFVRDVAQKKMGIDFTNQLMEHPNECTPELDGEIMAYLAIYAQLHKEAEIYIAVPEAGNANHIQLWRWDRPTMTLQKVLDNTGGFPVQFALLGGTGMNFSGLNVETTPPDTTFDPEAPAPPTPPTATPQLTPDAIPFSLQLRGHVGRFIGLVGATAAFPLGKATDEAGEEVSVPWFDKYQISDDLANAPLQGTSGATVDDLNVHSEPINRTTWVGAGFMLGKEAARGIGIRGYARWGWTNVPHRWDATVHGGLTTMGPLGGDGRFKTVLDADAYVGVVIPHGKSYFDAVAPTLGIAINGGITF